MEDNPKEIKFIDDSIKGAWKNINSLYRELQKINKKYDLSNYSIRLAETTYSYFKAFFIKYIKNKNKIKEPSSVP